MTLAELLQVYDKFAPVVMGLWVAEYLKRYVVDLELLMPDPPQAYVVRKNW